MAKEDPIIRKHLNADALRKTLRERFQSIEDKRVKPGHSALRLHRTKEQSRS
jgi:hypothetical protein